MHAKTDSDITSLPESSPTRSPPRRGGSGHGQVYYVQSPSRDSTSHDGEKTTNSFHSTPVISPMGSPPHSHSNSSLGPHSRESSSTRYSGSAKPKGGKGRSSRGGRHNHHDQRHPFDAIEEEGLLAGEDEDGERSIPRRCWYFIWFVVAFFLLMSFFSLVLWGASRNQKPVITMKSIKFEQFDIQAGQDNTGVPTGMATVNVTVKMSCRVEFGVTEIVICECTIMRPMMKMEYFYQRRTSQRQITVQLKGDSVPLYGGGHSISNNNKGVVISPVPLTLNFRVRSRAYVLGKLVKPKFYKAIKCIVVMNPKKMNVAMSLKNNCTYT
uniref:Late embryogenesis abundant protein LEA-2 subgroup domain-containing protein n=1 Tax=Chenopodium quinoa TaxID=63459 RepID=A0A803KXY1_CHEQI